MSSIFTKESTIKQFPNLAQEYVQPLFVEAGNMPDRKGRGKSKSCQIYINNAGLFFLRPVKLSKAFKISMYVPLNTITEIIYENQKRRTINCSKGRTFLECPHIEKAIECIISSRNAIFPNLQQIIFIGFPTPPSIIQLSTPAEKIPLLRYLNLCYLNEDEIDPSACQFLSTFDARINQSITFDSNYTIPRRCSFFFKSIGSERIRTIYLKNFSPYGVCRCVHFIIKGIPSISKIIFDGYSTLVPNQLRPDNLKPRIPISFAFFNCKFTDSCFISLIENISKLNGEIQRFSIENMSLSSESWNYLFYAFDTFKAWNTLECCDFNGVDLKEVSLEDISTSILILQRRCRFIKQLSLSNWVQPIPITIDSFAHSSALNQLILQKQDFTEIINEKTRLPSYILYIDVSQSTFTAPSLLSFFKLLLSIPKKAITLNFADIIMPENSWPLFYSGLSSLSEINIIKGINWGGNPIDSSSISSFYQFFFVQNCVSYLNIDRVFNINQINDLRNLITSIGSNKLFGLSIGGSSTNNFSGSMKQILDILHLLGNSLLFLHLDGQKVTNVDSPSIIDFIRSHTSIVDFSMDDTGFLDESQLFEFYDNIFQIQKISIVGRPISDLNRLLGGPNLSSLNDTNRFNNFRRNFNTKQDPLQETLLAFFLCRFSSGMPSDPQRYIAFYSKIPDIFNPLDYVDEYSLGFIQKKPAHVSILTLFVHEPCKTLTDLQNKMLVPPDRSPNYRSTKYGILKPLQTAFADDQANISNTENIPDSSTGSSIVTSKGYENNYNSGTFNSFDNIPINPPISNNPTESHQVNSTTNIINNSSNSFEMNSSNANVNNQQFGGMAGVASSGIQLEPLADSPEMRSVLSILSGIFDEEELNFNDCISEVQAYTTEYPQQQPIQQPQQFQQNQQQQFVQQQFHTLQYRSQQARPGQPQRNLCPGQPQTFKNQQLPQPQCRARSSSQTGVSAQQPLIAMQQQWQNPNPKQEQPHQDLSQTQRFRSQSQAIQQRQQSRQAPGFPQQFKTLQQRSQQPQSQPNIPLPQPIHQQQIQQNQTQIQQQQIQQNQQSISLQQQQQVQQPPQSQSLQQQVQQNQTQPIQQQQIQQNQQSMSLQQQQQVQQPQSQPNIPLPQPIQQQQIQQNQQSVSLQQQQQVQQPPQPQPLQQQNQPQSLQLNIPPPQPQSLQLNIPPPQPQSLQLNIPPPQQVVQPVQVGVQNPQQPKPTQQQNSQNNSTPIRYGVFIPPP